MPPIIITRNLAPAGKGGSGAQIMADAAGNIYYVKFRENGQLLKILANEYVAGKIAQRLNLPCPDVHIVELETSLASTIPPINGLAISQGPHFGSSQLNNLYTIPNIRGIIPKCQNTNDFPSIILFDALLYNVDRKNDGNFIVTTTSSGYQFNIIDHGHCFGSYWDEATLTGIVGVWSDSYLDEMYQTITHLDNFQPVVQTIKAIPDDFFTTLVNEIPVEWLPITQEREALIRFLIAQRDNIDTMLFGNKSKFFNCP